LETRYYVLQDERGLVSVFANYTQLRARLLGRGESIFVPNVPQSIFNIGTDFDAPLCRPNSPHRLSGIPYLQLITDPFALKPKDTMKVRLYFEGKPLADAGVEIGDGVTPRAEENIPRYKTDASGVAEVPIAQPRLRLLVVEHATPAIHPDLCDQDVAIATLRFVLPASH